MANLCITSLCNRSCSRYCFAGLNVMRRPDQAAHMDWTVFCTALDFIQRSTIDSVRILGGEPTLHPQFERMVEEVFSRGLKLTLFSNEMGVPLVCRGGTKVHTVVHPEAPWREPKSTRKGETGWTSMRV